MARLAKAVEGTAVGASGTSAAVARGADGGSDGRGVGFYFRNVTELLLFGVRGRNARTLPPGRRQVNYIGTRKREHSRKPDGTIVEIRVGADPNNPQPGDIREFDVDNSLIKRDLGLEFERDFERGLNTTLDWALSEFAAKHTI
jgi:nucleoside-diphosphate-sugar epimerase